jgi:hypothetical protein
MKGLGRLGAILLAIWLIVHGLTQLVHFSFNGMHMAMAILAIAAGVLLAIGG